jgi:hypothetical protein
MPFDYYEILATCIEDEECKYIILEFNPFTSERKAYIKINNINFLYHVNITKRGFILDRIDEITNNEVFSIQIYDYSTREYKKIHKFIQEKIKEENISLIDYKTDTYKYPYNKIPFLNQKNRCIIM